MSYDTAMKKLAEVIVGGGGAASIAFSSIPGTYRSLQVVLNGSCSASAGDEPVLIQFNGDTASNYDALQSAMHVSGTATAETVAGTSIKVGDIVAATGPANSSDSFTFTIPNYAGTTFHKTVLSSFGLKVANTTGNLYGGIDVGWWRSTAAITSILLFPASGNFVQNSVCSLYGLT